MTASVSIIDHSGVDRSGLGYIAALRDLHKSLDPHWQLRQYLGVSLMPEACRLLPLGDGLLMVARVLP